MGLAQRSYVLTNPSAFSLYLQPSRYVLTDFFFILRFAVLCAFSLVILNQIAQLCYGITVELGEGNFGPKKNCSLTSVSSLVMK